MIWKAHSTFTAHDGNHLSKGFWNYNKFLWSTLKLRMGAKDGGMNPFEEMNEK